MVGWALIRGCAWQGGACVAGCACHARPPWQILWLQHTANEWAVCILLECNLVTTRKRSLRRLCFYTCLLFCPQGGHAWLLPGKAGGCAWLLGGVCVVALGGHVWLLWGACVVALGGHAWLPPGGCVHWIRRDTVNERAIRILLECILVLNVCTSRWLPNRMKSCSHITKFSLIFPLKNIGPLFSLALC